jgi:thiamine biosynthesis protein ThiS
MNITLNGAVREVAESLTVGGLLAELNLTGMPVVVELNRLALLPREVENAAIKNGDVIEIIQITAGG